jgi:hypothetical protein
MAKAYARPEKEGFVLVKFFYGTDLATQARYTDWDQPFLGHTSEPRMSLEIPENTGTFDKRELRILLPLDVFTTRVGSGVPFSPIYVTIEELTQGLFTGDQSSQKVLYAGRVIRTAKNFQGANNKVAFFSLPVKSRIDVSMGLPCNHHCAWTLFKGGCGVTPVTFIGEIDSKDGTEATVTNAPILAKGAADARYWKRGYMVKDGLRIAIREYDGATDTGKFYTARPVPTDWVGGTGDITFTPGCDKTIETCRARWTASGEEFFMGLGYAIPAYSPNFETPG